MKCPVCWSEKAYRREVQSWMDALLRCLLLVPFTCQHCFHRFYVPWFLTLGKVTRPPTPSKANRRPRGASRSRKRVSTADSRPVRVIRPRRTCTPSDGNQHTDSGVSD